MNVLEILTLNKHGDFEEVLFSSTLSYFLNPNNDHGLKHIFLNKILKEIHVSYEDLNFIKLESEKSFNNAGNVDIFIEFDNFFLAIEVKIWDRSAKNKSSDDKSQLERYCKYLKQNFKDKPWILLFLIPNIKSPICLAEFNNVNNDEFKNNVKLMTWNSFDEENTSSNIILKSISEIIDEIYSDIKRVNIPLHTQWLLDSLYDSLPSLLSQIKDEKRFPSKNELMELDTWKIFEPFFQNVNRWPNPLHTVVGVPFGRLENKSTFHQNTLYRIRTTKDYYNELQLKKKNYPTKFIEIELWSDVYESCKDKLSTWLNKYNGCSKVKDGYHLDANKTNEIKLLIIHKIISNEAIENFNEIIKEGFLKAKKEQ